MMKFRTIKAAVKTLLANSASGRYILAGSQRQSKSADEVIDDNRLVQVYYHRGSFSKRGGSMHGPNDHEITLKIDFTVSEPAQGDIATLNNANSTAGQIQSAIANIAFASDLADDSIDELFDIIYQVLMNAENIDLGLSVDTVADRWISDFQKDEPVQRGELLVLTGTCNLTCKASEEVTGETPIEGNKIDTDFSIEGDLGDNAGVSVDPTN